MSGENRAGQGRRERPYFNMGATEDAGMREFAAGQRVPVVTGATTWLPAIMSEGLVGLRHPVDVVLLLVRAALLVRGVRELARELLGHALLATIARVLYEPAEREGPSPALRHLDRHLVVRTTHAA